MERILSSIPEQEILHYLGCEAADDLLQRQIVEAVQSVLRLARPKIVYQIVSVQGYENDLHIPLHGEDIKRLLATSHHAIFMAATLGNAIDIETKRLSLQDMGRMLVFDAVCNAAIEAVADQFEEEQRSYYRDQDQYFTDRFSCGYGDLSIDIQKAFCEALDTKRKIGLFVNASHLLIPLKSITALIGISDVAQPKRITGCERCDRRDFCELRKRGNRCG